MLFLRFFNANIVSAGDRVAVSVNPSRTFVVYQRILAVANRDDQFAVTSQDVKMINKDNHATAHLQFFPYR